MNLLYSLQSLWHCRSTAALAESHEENAMKRFVAAAFLASMIAGSGFANAMPLAPTGPAADGDIIKVEGGCGPGFHRGAYGRCRPNRGEVVVVPGAPVVVERPVVVGRRCPPGMAWRYGRCRPF